MTRALPTPSTNERRLWPLLAVTLAVLGTLAAMVAGLILILPPDPAPVDPVALREFFLYRSLIPEPTERTIYLAGLALLPIAALLGGWFARPAERADQYVFLIVVGLTAIIAAVLANSYEMRVSFGVEQRPMLLWIAAALAIGWLTLAWRWKKGTTWVSTHRRTIAAASFAAVAVAAGIVAFSWRTWNLRTVQGEGLNVHHLEAVMYSATQAVGGRLPLVDYPAQYGFYATFLAPWFTAVGVTVWPFTFTMNALALVAVLAIVVFAFREMDNLPLAVGASAVVIHLTVGGAPLHFDRDPYFQYMPVRFLLPALSVLAVREWLRRPTRWAAGVISLLAGVSLVWNLDSGVAVAGSWLALLGFRAAITTMQRRQARRWTKETLIAAALIALPVLLFAFWLRWRAGHPIDYRAAFQYQQSFYGYGFLMLPMPDVLHPWQVVLGLYVVGFVVGTFRALGTITDERAGILHYLSILGLGLFVYYQGRSHERVFLEVIWPAALVAFLLADRALTLSVAGRIRREIGVAAAAPTLTIGVLAAMLIVADVADTTTLWRQNTRAPILHPGIAENVAFIRAQTRGRRDAIVLSRYQATYFAESGLVSTLRGPGLSEILTRSEAAEMVREIRRHPDALLFIGPPYDLPRWTMFPELIPLLSERYERVDRRTTEELTLYRPRGGTRDAR